MRRPLIIRLRSSWRRFPYALTAVGAAPRFVPGPFKLVSGTKRLVVARREGLTLQFRRLGARAAVQQFRAGRAGRGAGSARRHRRDESRRAARERRPSAHAARPRSRRVRRDRSPSLRRAYRDTADRGDYEQLVSELSGAGALRLPRRREGETRRGFAGRSATIPTLPRCASGSASRPIPALRTGARLLYAQWRDVGLGPQLAHRTPRPTANVERVLAAYPQEEAIPAELVLRDGSGRALLAARTRRDTADVAISSWSTNGSGLRREPSRSRGSSTLASSLRDCEGWREDVLGDVDYSAVRSRASSRRP